MEVRPRGVGRCVVSSDSTKRRGVWEGWTRGEIRRHARVPVRTVWQMAWHSITLRRGRSAVTMFGVLLGLAFFSAVVAGTFTMAQVGGGTIAATDRSRLVWLVGISLVTAAVGVANSMVQAVAERAREIGTMKALGALSSFIRLLFLFEAGTLGFLGSFFGMALGWGMMALVYGLKPFGGVDVVSFGALAVLGLCGGVGFPFVMWMYASGGRRVVWGRVASAFGVVTFVGLVLLVGGLFGTVASAASSALASESVNAAEIHMNLAGFVSGKGALMIWGWEPRHCVVQLFGLLLGTLLSILVAFYPAARAAAMDPVVAFRVDPMG